MEEHIPKHASSLLADKHIRYWLTVAVFFLVPIIYLLVCHSPGGMRYVYSHFMYLPIIIASLCLGKRAGLVMALEGAILFSPFMPIDLDANIPEKELFTNWIFRISLFIINALIFGFYSDELKRSFQKVMHLYTHNMETGILNFQSLNTDSETGSFFDSGEKHCSFQSHG